MLRRILAVLAGAFVFGLLGTLLFLLLRLAWPEYARVEISMAFTPPMMLARLAAAALCVIAGGWTAARIASGDLRAAWWLGVLLLLVFIPVHYQLWQRLPAWYHLTFLLTLIPLAGLGGRLGR